MNKGVKGTEKLSEIEKQIETLSPGDRNRFGSRLLDNLYNKNWCNSHGINYDNPDTEDTKRAKEITYQEMFG